METVKALIPILLTLSLGGLVAAVGAQSTLGDLLSVLRKPGVLLRAVLAVNVIVPIVAAILIALFPMSLYAKTGIMLMAISPVPPLVPGKQAKVGARRDFGYGLYVALVGLTVIMVPLSVAILNRVYPVELVIPPGGVLRNVTVSVFIPLLIGLAIRRFAPGFAERGMPIVEKVSMGLLLIVFVVLVAASGKAMIALIGNGAIVAVILTVLAALAAGHFLADDDPRDRAALALTAATRHPGIAMMIATASFNEPRITAAILGFLIVGILAALPYNMWMKRRLAAVAA